MLKALVLKELREVAPIAGLALCAYTVIVARATGLELVFWPREYTATVPFVSDGFTEQITFISACLAVALAAKQTLGESWRSTWLWLLHRPLDRRRILTVKLATGAVVYLVCGALSIIWYSCWAALPRTHPSPFYWSMTAGAWDAWWLTGALYLAAFWCGLWPARSLGPRWMPLVATGAAVMFGAALLGPITQVAVWLLPLLLGCLLVSNIFVVGRTRDFS